MESLFIQLSVYRLKRIKTAIMSPLFREFLILISDYKAVDQTQDKMPRFPVFWNFYLVVSGFHQPRSLQETRIRQQETFVA